MELAYDSVESVMKMQSDGSVYLKPRTTKSFGDSKLLADMTASIPEMNVFGIKHYVVNDGKYFYYIYLVFSVRFVYESVLFQLLNIDYGLICYCFI